MTFFEQELRKLFADGAVIKNPRFAGRACFGTLGKDLRVRVQFVTSGHADHYDAMSVSVLNRTDGVVDKLRIRLKDVLGIKPVPGNPNFRNGVSPYIWDDHGKAEWYAFRPSGADYDAMRQAVGEYLDVFRERAIEREHTGPKLIYICAPLPWGGGKEHRLRQRESAGGVRGGRHPHLPPSRCSLPLRTRQTPHRTRRHGRWACGWWSPASRSMSMAPSGQMGCGRRSTTPKCWGSPS